MAAPAVTPALLPGATEEPGKVRVLVISTIAFTLMFAVWLMFGVLGIPDPAAAHESLAEPVAVGATTMERTEG